MAPTKQMDPWGQVSQCDAKFAVIMFWSLLRANIIIISLQVEDIDGTALYDVLNVAPREKTEDIKKVI